MNTDLDKLLCPECGGIYFAGSLLMYEHRDSQCSMRWINGQWIPVEEIKRDEE